jgi:hypothetical protein
MKDFRKRLELSLSTGYIFCYFGELMFWATPCRAGMTISGIMLTWLLYAFFAYVFLCIVSVFRVRSLWAVFLAGAFFGWYEEGIVVQTMYGTPDGPFPMSISFTGLAWHAIIGVCVGWLLVRWVMDRGKATEIIGLAVMIGVFYGLWAIWWWIEPPEPMRLLFAAERLDLVFVHFGVFVLSTTALLVFAYWLHNRLMPFEFRPSQGELWFVGIVTTLYYLLVTVPAAPRALWVLPPLMAMTFLALHLNRGSEFRADAISAFSHGVKPLHYLLLFFIPLVAAAIYFIGLATGLRVRTNIVVYYTFGIAGAVLWIVSVVQPFLRKKPR